MAALCALALVPAANYFVDPSCLFNTSRADAPELAASEIMLSGSNAAGLRSNYNERLLRREYIRGFEGELDTLVAGSSRGELISSDMLGLGEGELFNASVAGGELEDAMSFMGLLLQKGAAPKTLLLSLDPWTLNDSYSQKRYLGSISDGYYYILKEMGLDAGADLLELEPLYDPDAEDGGLLSLPLAAREELFSIPYFQDSVEYLFSADYSLYREVSATGAREGASGIVRADGSYCYPEEYRRCDAEVSSERARRSLPNVIGLEDYKTLKGNRYELFKSFIEFLTARGIEVRLVMFPLGNTIYDHMAEPDNRAHYALFFRSEELFRELADETGASISGTFDPYAAGFTMADFYDGYHLKEARIAEMLGESQAKVSQ